MNVFLSLVHTARQATKDRGVRSRCANRKEAGAEDETVDWDLGLSRNKVTVGEPAVGSPPF